MGDSLDDIITFLSPKNFPKTSNLNACWEKTRHVLKSNIETREYINNQREDKIQQDRHDQLLRLKHREEEFLKKCQVLEKKISESSEELRENELTYLDLTKKLASEKELMEELREKKLKLLSEKQTKDENFHKTLKNYTMVINWYREYLNLDLELDTDNPKIFKLILRNKNQDKSGWVKFEMLDETAFKLTDVYPAIQSNKENVSSLQYEHELPAFLYSLRKALTRQQNDSFRKDNKKKA